MSCCDARCRLARSLNVALRAQSPRPASLRSPAPRPATASAFASLSPRAKPARTNLPAARAASSRVCRHRATPTISPAARLRRGKAHVAREAYRARPLSGAPSRSPASGGNMLRASLARWRGFDVGSIQQPKSPRRNATNPFSRTEQLRKCRAKSSLVCCP